MKIERWEKKLDAEGFLVREMVKKSDRVMCDEVVCGEVNKDRYMSNINHKQSNDQLTFERAMSIGLNDSRFASWSRRGKCALVLLRETTPKFSMSDMVAEYLEQGLERDHPNLMRKVDEYLKTQKRGSS